MSHSVYPSIPFARRRKHQHLRQRVMAGYQGICHICGGPFADAIDHVVPVDLGGSDHIDNLRPAHTSCNSSKGASPPPTWAELNPQMWIPGYGPNSHAGRPGDSPSPVEARRVPAPGTAALTLSILGMCGFTAILGVALGCVALISARRQGKSRTKAAFAIGIGLAWIVPLVAAMVAGALIPAPPSQDSDSYNEAVAATQAPSPSAPSSRAATPQLDAAYFSWELMKIGFECTSMYPEFTTRCTKTSIRNSKKIREVVDLEDNAGPSRTLVHGSAKKGTVKVLRKSGAKTWGESRDGLFEFTN